MITVIKTTTTTVLLSALLCTASNVEARLKYYRYNANIPMVETTLNMMVAMGVIEQIPGYLVHDGNPYSRLANAQYGRDPRTPYAVPVNYGYYSVPGYDRYRGWGLNPYASAYNPYASNYNPYASSYNPYASSYNPYATSYYPYAGNYYSSTYGYPYGYGGGNSNWNNPWGSQWVGDPWSVPQLTSPWNTTWGDPWTNPQWSSPYSTWGNTYSGYGSQLYSPWSSLWGNRLNTPWTNSWNYPWGVTGNNLWASPLYNTQANPFVNPLAGTAPGTAIPGYPGNMVSPNYTPGLIPDNSSSYNFGNSGPSSFTNDNPVRGAPSGSDASKVNSFSINNISLDSSADPLRWSNASKPNRANRTVNRRLDGLWIGDRGEMLGIRGDNFLWYDGKDRYANGTLRSTPTMLMVTRAGTRRELSMHYRLAGNELRTVGRSGKTRTFQRKPLMQQSQLASELYASPSSYQMNSTSPFASQFAPGPGGATVLLPYPGDVSDSANGSLPTYIDQQSDRAGLKSNWGEKSPLWSPGANAAAGEAATDTKASREVGAYRNTTDPLADDAPSAVDSGSAERSTSRIDKLPGLTAVSTTKSAKALRQMQQHEPSRAETRHHKQIASTTEPESDQRGVVWNSLIPISTLSPTTRNSALPASIAPFRSNLPVATDTIAPASRTPERLTNIWRQRADEKIQPADASKYLYSYFKASQHSIPKAASPIADNRNIWSSTTSRTSNAEFGFKAPPPPDKTADSSNIWKPSAAFTEKQRKGYVANVYYSAANDATDAQMRANAKVKKFVWAD